MTTLSKLTVFLLFCAGSVSAASQTEVIDAVVAADAERMAATIAADRERLHAIYSEEMRYAHSSGVVDDKDAMIESLTSGQVKYESFEYLEREFLMASAGVVLMSGRVIIHVEIPERKVVVDLNFLSVWRKEEGRWRFLSWQSSTNPVP